ncbi:MAG: PP2C family serine/threonine-protein phosphatase [Cyanobacteriota bacterium ELA615]
MDCKAVVSSEIGTSHQKLNLPCQDYAQYCLLENRAIIGAVSDGAGSAKHSEIGSKLAVETVLGYLKGVEQHTVKSEDSLPPSLKNVRQIFTAVVKKVQEELQQLSDTNNYKIEDLACTLLIFIATSEEIMAMQIGDGFIVIRPSNEEYQLLFKPNKGEYANETTFITSSTAIEDMQVDIISKPISFICASTDGLEKVAIKLSNYSPYERFFNPLETYLQETVELKEEDYLKPFLQSPSLNSRTDDDKSLLIALFKE